MLKDGEMWRRRILISQRPSESGASNLGVVGAMLVLAVAIGIVGALILNHVGQVEDGVAIVGERVSEMEAQLDEAVALAGRALESSEDAVAQALRAEESAAEAAMGRQTAEEAQLRAESERAQAQAEAAAANQEAAQARLEFEQMEQERQAELDRLQKSLSQIVETRRTALGVVMNLGSDAIEFEFDRADLGPSDRELLSRIVGVLLTSTGYRVYVYGHTDDVGTEEYNQVLSERRADAVRDYLVESGIPVEIIATRGYGQSSPRVPGDSSTARARNRRVEIGVVDVSLDYQGEARGQ